MIKSSFREPTGLFLNTVVAYALLQSIASLTGSGTLKLVANLSAFVIFMIMIVNWAFLPKKQHIFIGFSIALSVYYFGMLGSTLMHLSRVEYADLLKMLMAPAFLLFGIAFESNRRTWLWDKPNTRLLFWSLIIMPFLVWLWQLAIGATSFNSSSFGAVREVAFFANRNNAALYAVTLLAFFNVLSGRPIKNVLIYFGAGVMFGTLGVLLALVLSLIISTAKLNTIKYFILAFLLFAALYFLAPDLWIFSRISPVINSFIYIYNGTINLNTATYADLVRILHTTDLSFIFRLKHWLNLLNIFSGGSEFEWLFGFGIGSSVRLSDIGLVPHNDYLRYLFETGFITLIGFVMMIAIIALNCGRRWESVPLVTIALYFFSENLINNYLAMSIFYFCAGALVLRIKSDLKINRLTNENSLYN